MTKKINEYVVPKKTDNQILDELQQMFDDGRPALLNALADLKKELNITDDTDANI